MIRQIYLSTVIALGLFGAMAQQTANEGSKVYFTQEITPEALEKIYKALGVEATGRVEVKISTIAERGYNDISNVDLMDIKGSVDIPVTDTKWLQFNRVGDHIANYDFLINLAHFKGMSCLDLVFNHQSTSGDNATPLQQRIERQHGTHIVDYAEEIGLGSRSYQMIDLADLTGVDSIYSDEAMRYNVYNLEGEKIMSNAKSIETLPAGIYVINGRKVIIENK